MIIEMYEIPIRDVVNGYVDSAEDGVVAFNGQLNVRPAFQREFVYKDKQRDEVINTVRKGFPLNVMYWVRTNQVTGEEKDLRDKKDKSIEEIKRYKELVLSNGLFEILDGQQRTISICQYKVGDFSIDYQYFHNLTDDEKEQILDYKLMVYICEGNDREKLDWFKIINIAGEKLTDQELRNAIYTGTWLTDAKRYFSKSQCAAYMMANKYMKGTPIRQDYLESVLKWIAAKENMDIELYMAQHQHDTNAAAEWLYFNQVITWVQAIFPNYRKEMQGVEWGILYNKYGGNPFDANDLEDKIKALMVDEDVTKKQGIYYYLLDGKESNLSIRAFSPKMKREAYERQNGICPNCNGSFTIEEMEADHITPWHSGGTTTADNCQMLCKDCNRRKSGI